MSSKENSRENSGARSPLQVKQLPYEKLEGIALQLASEIEREIRKRFGDTPFFEIKVTITEDWPYILEVTANVPSLSEGHQERKELDEVLEDVLKRFEKRMREEGLQPV